MRIRAVWTYLLVGGSLAGIAAWRAMPVHGNSMSSSGGWNRQASARYLDNREVWWQRWPRAQKDHGTMCISCHTVVPYAMARPGLRKDIGETAMNAPEKIMLDNVERRVSHWPEMVPFYSDEDDGPGKTAESHATEAVLNAVILATYDASHGHVRPITRTAFDEAWALQEKTGEDAGGWRWQNFHLAPWESAESGYQGAALLFLEALSLPDGFVTEPVARQHLDELRHYLRRKYAVQPVINQLYILWASARAPGLLTQPERKALVASIERQQQADGGWRTMTMAKSEWTEALPRPTESDGYATGLTVLALEESGAGRDEMTLQRGLKWLTEHQERDGSWSADSINKKRDPQTDASLFMRDASTAYAVLALEKAR